MQIKEGVFCPPQAVNAVRVSRESVEARPQVQDQWIGKSQRQTQVKQSCQYVMARVSGAPCRYVRFGIQVYFSRDYIGRRCVSKQDGISVALGSTPSLLDFSPYKKCT